MTIAFEFWTIIFPLSSCRTSLHLIYVIGICYRHSSTFSHIILAIIPLGGLSSIHVICPAIL
ncbi:hypothetical protein BDR07DRAFT_822894 [Suillus spraguei]|nr:hypothetical protein BDR07DRAFT_822894 [Suillus spraguei]